MTGIAVKPEAGEPPTLGRAGCEPADVEAGRKACGEGEQFVFQYKTWKCEVHYEKTVSCIEKFRRTIA
jgi:hypothetical protein